MIVGVSGHQKLERASVIAWVKHTIEAELQSYPRSIGVSSLAAGTDQIFAAIVLDLGWDLHVVVPCDKYKSTFTNSNDRFRFEKLFSKARRRETLNFPAPGEEAFLRAGQHIVEVSNLMMFVWNGLPALGRGGTAEIVDYAVAKSVPFIHINPVELKVQRSGTA